MPLAISGVTPFPFKALNPNVLVSLAAIGVVVMSFAIEYEFASADTGKKRLSGLSLFRPCLYL